MRTITVLISAAALTLAFPLSAQKAKAATPPPVAAPSKGIAATSSEVEKQVLDLTKAIRWHDSLAAAKAAAKSSGKPIFWMHMLGDLSGST